MADNRLILLRVVAFLATSALSAACVATRSSSEIAAVSADGRDVVLSYNTPARDAARAIFGRGGNAFDAFVAATFVEYVYAPGVTSLAGPLSALIYDSDRGAVRCLDGNYNAVRDPAGAWSPAETAVGKTVLVPGAVAALELLARDKGRLAFADLVQPAIELAEHGFRLDHLYAAEITYRKDILQRSEYGRATFFTPNGEPLAEGAELKQPVLAAMLRELAAHGSDYVYHGAWAEHAVAAVRGAGGLMQADDLAAYRAVWREPRVISHAGADVYAAPGRTIGGLHTLLALKLLDQTQVATDRHFSESADDLEKLVRISRYVYGIIGALTPEQLDDEAGIQQLLSPPSLAEMWRQISAHAARPSSPPLTGSHSFHIIVADHWGNVITGTNTINALPWGEGLFVDGVPLNASAKTATQLKAGEREISELGMHIVLHDGHLAYASGAFNSGLMPANFEFLTNVLDYRLAPDRAVSLPRFGGFPIDFTTLTVDPTSNWLDPRVSADIVHTLEGRGLKFQQQGYLDTGDGGLVAAQPDGSFVGAYSPSTLER